MPPGNIHAIDTDLTVDKNNPKDRRTFLAETVPQSMTAAAVLQVAVRATLSGFTASLLAGWKERQEEKEQERKLKIGSFEFAFGENFSAEEVDKMSHVIKITFREIDRYIPIDKRKREIKIAKNSNLETSYQFHQKGATIEVGKTWNEGLLIHELVHVFHGEKALQIHFIEEGLATAIAHLIAKKTNLETMLLGQSTQLGPTLMEGGLGLRPDQDYRAYPPISGLRYLMAAKTWLEMEKIYPGFIRKFHEAYYRFLKKGGKKDIKTQESYVDLATKIDPRFRNIHSGNPIIRKRNRPKEGPLLYAYYDQGKDSQNKDVKVLAICVVEKEDSTGLEKGLSGRRVIYRFVNSETGKESEAFAAVTDEQGALYMQLNNDKALESIGKSAQYRAIVEVPDFGIGEELDFNYR